MRNFVVAAGFAAVVGLAACTHETGVRITDISAPEASAETLKADQAVLVSVPDDGNYNHKSYPGSGQDIAKRTAAAFSRYASRVEIAASGLQKPEELLAAARSANAGYLIIPTIVHWEPRSTEWTLIPRQVDIDLAVIKVETGRELRSTVLEGRYLKSSPAENTLQEMYSSILVGHVADLYGSKTPPKQP
jgi:hypothetical protein